MSPPKHGSPSAAPIGLAKRMEAGTIYLNCQLANDYTIPFGGPKQSGWGYEYGWKGIESYLKMKSIFPDITT